MIGYAILGLLGAGFLIGGVGGDSDFVDGNQGGNDEQENEFIDGTTGDDSIVGSDEADRIDRIRGDLGDDTIRGGAGDDRIFAGTDVDATSEDSDRDVVYGDAGNDLIRGGGDTDVLIGGEGTDTLEGDLGRDILDGENMINETDVISGTAGSIATVADGAIIPFLNFDGDSGTADVLNGGEGDDVIIAGSNDTIDSGIGFDQIIIGPWIAADQPAVIEGFSDQADTMVFAFQEGEPTPDNVSFAQDADGVTVLQQQISETETRILATFPGLEFNEDLNLENLVIASTAAELIQGSTEADSLTGTELGDTIFGDAGDDTLVGLEERDRIFGGVGADSIFGDAGNDFLRGGADNDMIVGGTGQDSLFGDLGSDTLDGAGVVEFDAEGDVVSVNSGGDDGEQDALIGGFGNDVLVAGSGDIVTTGPVTGTDADGAAPGQDTVVIGSWIAPGDPAVTVTDFNPEFDTIDYVYEGTTAPTVTFETQPDGTVNVVVGNTPADTETIAVLTLEGATAFSASNLNLVQVT